MQEPPAERSGEQVRTQCNKQQRDGRGQCEACQRSQAATIPRSLQPDGKADLTARGTWKELAERHQIRISRIIEPAAAGDKLFSKIADVGDGPAKMKSNPN